MKGADVEMGNHRRRAEEEPNGRMVVVLPDGKKYNVKLEDDGHKK